MDKISIQHLEFEGKACNFRILLIDLTKLVLFINIDKQIEHQQEFQEKAFYKHEIKIKRKRK